MTKAPPRRSVTFRQILAGAPLSRLQRAIGLLMAQVPNEEQRELWVALGAPFGEAPDRGYCLGCRQMADTVRGGICDDCYGPPDPAPTSDPHVRSV